MTLVLNESFKALVEKALPQKEQSQALIQVFEEVVNDRATTQKIGLDELKSRAIDEIKAEFVTKDFLRAEIAEVRAEMAEIRAEIVKSKIDTLRWVFGMQIATIAMIGAMLKIMLP